MHLATKLAAVVLATLCATAPVYAIAADPTGTWQADDGKSRYKITECGSGETVRPPDLGCATRMT